MFLQLDVTSKAQAKTAVETALKRFGRIDVLINNAGYSLLGNFEELTSTAIERQFATNFFGVMHVMRAVLPVMRSQRSGHLNVASVAVAIGFKSAVAYSATKFAVEGLSLSVPMEVEQFVIKVTVVEPGFFRTDLLDAQSVEYGGNLIEDYAAPGSVKAAWEVYNQQQPGDPAKLGAALVKIAEMESSPKQFLAGSDAIAMVTPGLEARLKQIQDYADLSKSTDGTF